MSSSRPRQRVLVLVTTIVSLILAGAVSSMAAEDGAPLAHLRLEITTTSNWTILRIDKGWILAQETRSTDNADVSHNFSAVRVNRAAAGRPATAIVDLVVDTVGSPLHEPNTVPVTVVMSKAGGGGGAEVTVTNLNDAKTPRHVATLTDPGPAAAEEVARVPADEFFSTTPVTFPRATTERQVIAAYYPWFSDSGDPRLTPFDHPTLGDQPLVRRDADDPDAVAAEVARAAAVGIDGFAVEFGSTHLAEFEHVVAGARETRRPFVVAGLLSAKAAATSDDPAGTMLRWLRDLDAAATDAGDVYQRTPDDRPIVWIWGTQFFTPNQWAWFLDRVGDEGIDVAILHDGAPEQYQSLFDGHFRYGLLRNDPDTFSWWWARDAAYLRAQSLLDGTTPPLLATTVSPGHDDCAVRAPCTVIDREEGSRYGETWRRALAVDPDIVLVTSWNEWFESTNIAPSELFGRRALWLTWLWSTYWHAGA